MKTQIITELLKMEVLKTTTPGQLLEKADRIHSFLQLQDGFIDAEMIQPLEGNVWYFIYHIENMEKLRDVGEKLRNNKIFDDITPLIVPGSMSVSFFSKVKNW